MKWSRFWCAQQKHSFPHPLFSVRHEKKTDKGRRKASSCRDWRCEAAANICKEEEVLYYRHRCRHPHRNLPGGLPSAHPETDQPLTTDLTSNLSFIPCGILQSGHNERRITPSRTIISGKEELATSVEGFFALYLLGCDLVFCLYSSPALPSPRGAFCCEGSSVAIFVTVNIVFYSLFDLVVKYVIFPPPKVVGKEI